MNVKRVLIVTLLGLAASPAMAVTKNWTGSSGNWSPGNWSPAGVPAASDSVNIAFTDGLARTVTLNTSTPSLGLVSIDLTGAGIATSTLSLPSSNNLTATAIGVGGFNGSITAGGRGAVSQSAGTTTISAGGDLILGWGSGSVGTYSLAGGALVANQAEFVGLGGTGTFNHSAGTNTITASALGYLSLGHNAGASGAYNLSGIGVLASNESEIIGNSGAGVFNQTGGTNTISGAGSDLLLGLNAGSTGAYTISGGTLSVGSNIVVGSFGTGTLNIQGNGSVTTNGLSINGTSTVNLNGGKLRFGTVGGLNRLNYTSGTIQLDVSHDLLTDTVVTTLFGASPTIPSGKGLIFEDGADINTAVTVDGGNLTSLRELRVGIANEPGNLAIINGGTVVGGYGLADSEFSIIGDVNSNSHVTVSGPGSSLTIGKSLMVGYPDSTSSLLIRDQAIVYIDQGHLNIRPNGDVILDGGTIRLNTIFNDFAGGVFDFHSGTIQLSANRFIGSDPLITQFFGSAPTLMSGKGLTVEGTATLLTVVTLDGGTLSANQLANGYNLRLQRGTLNLTNQAVTIGTGGLLGNTLDLNDDMTVNVTLGIANQGVVTGDGQIGGTFSNAAAGQLRAEPGKSLKLTGANNTNAGRINLLGGQIEFTQNLTNNVGGLISGNGSILTGGMTNQGTMNFAGTANVLGDVTNAVGGKIISGGGGATVFFDDVTNNGEIRTSANGFTVFFGAVSGSGTFTGTGTVNFEGDLTPGSSPAAVSFGGDVILGPDSTLQIEIGGTTAGIQYDQINVAGELSLGGTLEISLINGFTPTAGQTLDLFGESNIVGSFSSLELPSLSGLSWDTSQLLSGVVSVVPGLLGDFDFDGDVDGRDFLAWQRNPNIGNLNDWQANYGAGSLVEANVAVPEPGSIVLMAFFCTAVLARSGNAFRA